MPEINGSANATASWKSSFRGWWLVALQALLYGAASRFGLHWAESLNALGDNPGKNPPWYFIRRDAVMGGSFAGALAIGLAVAVLARKRYPVYANMLAWMSVLSLGGKVWQTVVILFSTHDLLSPQTATTRWATFEAYTSDPLIGAGQVGVFLLTFSIAAVGFKKFTVRQHAA